MFWFLLYYFFYAKNYLQELCTRMLWDQNRYEEEVRFYLLCLCPIFEHHGITVTVHIFEGRPSTSNLFPALHGSFTNPASAHLEKYCKVFLISYFEINFNANLSFYILSQLNLDPRKVKPSGADRKR